jgi:predicted NBD/HSP70 family sugar kinase
VAPTDLDQKKVRIGIDLGGTKIELIALADNDSSGGLEVFRKRVPTPAQSYAEIVATIKQLIEDAEQQLRTNGSVGIGIPGAVSRSTGLIKNANTVCLIGQPFQADLERALLRPIRLANDANCFALSEATDGAGANSETVFGVILGTGIGGGIVIRGHVLEGLNAIAGEWGHNPLPWPQDDERPGPKCYCGKYGCIETFLSGPGLRSLHRVASGKDLNAEQIVQRALLGDELCEKSLLIYEDRLARALASVINILDPDVIVLGGGLSNLARLYENIPQRWHRYAFSDGISTRLARARHGDSSGVRGAAWLWPSATTSSQRAAKA